MTTQQTEVINQKLNGHYNKKINKAKDYNWSALYDRIDLMTYLNPLLGHKEKIKDNQYLCHCPLGHNHSKSGYDPKTRTMHHSGQDTAPSLLIRERTDKNLKLLKLLSKKIQKSLEERNREEFFILAEVLVLTLN